MHRLTFSGCKLLNGLCAGAMRPFVKITLIVCLGSSPGIQLVAEECRVASEKDGARNKHRTQPTWPSSGGNLTTPQY